MRAIALAILALAFVHDEHELADKNPEASRLSDAAGAMCAVAAVVCIIGGW